MTKRAAILGRGSMSSQHVRGFVLWPLVDSMALVLMECPVSTKAKTSVCHGDITDRKDLTDRTRPQMTKVITSLHRYSDVIDRLDMINLHKTIGDRGCIDHCVGIAMP